MIGRRPLLKIAEIVRATLGVVCGIAFAAPNATAADVPQSFTLDGRLYSDAAGVTPLEDSAISFTIQILDEDKVCTVYEESQTVSTAASKGYFSAQVGTVVGSPLRTAGDSGNTMTQVFQNMSLINGKRLSDGTACTVPPVGGKRRYVRIKILPPSMGGLARTLSPDLTIDSVPNAIVAERAESLQGLRSTDVLKVNTASGSALSQTNLESLFTSAARFNALSSIVDGTSVDYMRTNSPSGAQLPVMAGAPTSPNPGSVWYDSSDSKLKYQTSVGPITLGSGGGTVTSVGFTAPSELSVSGAPVSTSGTIAVTWATQTTNKVFAAPDGSTGAPTFRILTANDIPNLPWTKITTLLPTTLLGYGITDAVKNAGGTPSIQSGLNAAKGASTTAGRVWISTDTKEIYSDNGTSWDLIGTGGGGTVTSVSSANLYLSVATATTTPALTLNVGTAANTVAAGNDSRITGALPAATAFAGDVSGVYSATSVDKIKGTGVSITALGTGNFLRFDGTNWVNTNLVLGDVTTGLGFTPVNKAGDTMTGLLVLSADPSAALGASTKQYVDSSTSTASASYLRKDASVALTADWDADGAGAGTRKISGLADPTASDGAATKNYVDASATTAATLLITKTLPAAPAAGQDGQVLRWNNTTPAWEFYTPSTGTGTVTSVSSGNSYLSVATGTTTPALTLNVGTTANTVAAGDDSRITGALPAATAFAGDVSGVYSATSVDKIKGTGVAITTITSGNFLKYNGTNWVNSNLAAGDVTGALTYTPVNKAGDTMTGLLVLSADPSAALGASTKQYVDSSTSTAAANYLRKDASVALTADWDADGAGAGTRKISGLADPTASDGAATKNYADTKFMTKTLPAAPAAGQDGQALRWNNTTPAWEYYTPGAGSGDFLANGTVPMTGTLKMGGNTIHGNSTASGNLTLESTSNATKGHVLLAPNGGNVGIGMSTPAEKLEINGAIKVGTTANSNAGTIRWDGTNFQGYTGTTWTNFISAAAAGACDSTQTYTTAGTYSYTVPANYGTLTVRIWGGGGGGGGAWVSSPGTGSAGGTSSIISRGLTANGGSGGIGTSAGATAGGAGGTASGGDTNTAGANGEAGVANTRSGAGGTGANGGAGGAAQSTTYTNGNNGTGPGGGGSGARYSADLNAGGGGGGSFVEKVYTSATLAPSTSINDIVVGAGGAGGTTGMWGGNGATGRVTIICTSAGVPTLNDRSVLFTNSSQYGNDANFVYDASGKLGIGTAAPSTTLDVNGAATFRATAAPAATAAQGKLYFDTTANKFKVSENGGAFVDLVGAGTNGTVTSVSSANSYLSVATGTTTPALTLNVGTAANTVAAGDDSRITGALPAATAFAGDVSGVYSATSVDKIKGTGVAITTITSGNFLKFNGTNWVNSNLAAGDITGALTYTPVNKAGDTMTGLLVLSADPSAALGASTKQYVDSSTSTAAANYLRKDATVALTADWDVDGAGAGTRKIAGLADPTASDGAATKNYADTQFITKNLPAAPAAGQNGQSIRWNNATPAWEYYTPGAGSGDFLANGTVPMTGTLKMGGNTVHGNSTASGNLTLESTSDTTKGYVLLAPNGGNVGIGTTAPTTTLEVNGTIQAKNLVPGITPTAVGWTTDPTTLGNVTDGNEASATGEGVFPASGAATVTIDLGAVYRGMVFAYIKGRNGNAGGTTSVAVYQSDDDANYVLCSGGGSVTGTTLANFRLSCAFWGRYITLICSADAVNTGKCTFHEVYLRQYQ